MTLPLRLPKPGPLLEYLSWFSTVDQRKALDAQRAIQAALATEGGRILLDLLEKCLEKAPIPTSDDGRALAARNAQCFIASDLRRILSDETERLLEQQSAVASTRRTRRSPARP